MSRERAYKCSWKKTLKGQVELKGSNVRQIQRAGGRVAKGWKEAESLEILFNQEWREKESSKTGNLVHICSQRPSDKTGKSGLVLETMVEMFFTLHIYIFTYANMFCFVKLCKGKCAYEEIFPALVSDDL